MNRDEFNEWMDRNLAVKEGTKKRYLNTINNLSAELEEWGLSKVDLYSIEDFSYIDRILENGRFLEKDQRGNRMYSIALKHYKNYLLSQETKGAGMTMDNNNIENVVLIKINQSYQENMSPEDLYQATSTSWVASFGKTSTRDLKYYCAVYQDQILEVYDFLGYEEEKPKRTPSRYILQGKVSREELRGKLNGLNVSHIHGGRGNPIKYTTLNTLLYSKEQTISDLKGSNLITHIHAYIQSKGFNYSLANIKNLYLSLRSKPFVIISGISGTGKTKIVQLFAESVGATEENEQFKLIPIRPDWSDGSELLGYRDIKGDFIKGPLTQIVEQALSNEEKPYFVLLDEMNLARVEYYFSDILSVLESRRRDGEKISTSYLLQERKLRLPENLFIIGTVNMDETTHPFSKKVLDRANTIEFNEVNLESFSHLETQEEISVQPIDYKKVATSYISLKDVYESHKKLIKDISKKLAEINKLLEPLHAHIGYRVRDEICFYMIHNEENGLLEENEAFDFCLMQKILPRITGGDDRVLTVLTSLFELLAGQSYEMEEVVYATHYPRSVKKIEEMLRGYYADGFTSFWIT